MAVVAGEVAVEGGVPVEVGRWRWEGGGGGVGG